MSQLTRENLSFTAESICRGLRYHFRELGICRELEEGLVEKIEKRIGPKAVRFRHEIWNVVTGDLDRSMILLDLAGLTREDLQQSRQGLIFLQLERLWAQAADEIPE
jgi:hypothetical protein